MTGLSHIQRHSQMTDTLVLIFPPNFFQVKEVGEGGRLVCQNCVSGTKNSLFSHSETRYGDTVSLAKLLVDLPFHSLNVPTPDLWKE